MNLGLGLSIARRPAGFPPPPAGYVYLVDSSGNYLVNANGAYLIGAA